MERRFIATADAPVSVETRDDGAKFITGHGSVFYREGVAGTEYELWDGLVERIDPGAFDRALADKDDARGLFNHDPDNLLGRVSAGTLTLAKDETGLRYDITIDPDDPDHQRVVRKIERGDLNGSSFAFTVKRDEFIEGEDGEPDVRIIKEVKQLYDVGPVTFPAYEAADTGLRAMGDTTEARASYDAWKAGKVEQRDAVPDTEPVEVEPEVRDDELPTDDTDADTPTEQPVFDQDAIRRRNRARVVAIETGLSSFHIR